MVLRVMLVLAAAALLAGCGDDDEKRVDTVSSCLEKDYGDFVSTERPDLDPLAARAQDGGVSVITERQEVNIGLYESEAQAKEVVTAYEARGRLKKVQRQGTAVVAYTAKPTAQQQRTIAACLEKS